MQIMGSNIKQNNRSTNVELLRVLCMFLIVVIHYVYHGLGRTGYYTSFDMYSINDWLRYITLEPLWILALTAVNCYVMITGYFLVEKKDIRWKGIIRTIIQTLFYSLVIFCLFVLVNHNFSLDTLKRALIPIHSDYYWFVTSYIGLLFIAPFLSFLVSSLSKHQYQYILIVLFVINFEFLYGTVYSHQRSLLWFSFLYLIAGYLKIYGTPEFLIKHKGMILIATWIFLTLFATMYNALTWPSFKLKGSDYNGPVFFLSLVMFVFFINTSFNRGRLLVKVAPYTFGVYLIHDNPLVRTILWERVIDDSIKMPIFIHCLLVCLIVFSICILIDFLRAKIFHILKINEVMNKLSLKMPLL